jgi:hypothetical protein
MKIFVLGVALGLVSAACSAGTSTGSGGSGASSGTVNAGGANAGPGATGTTAAFITGSGGGGPTYGCSPDLKEVIDANGTVVMTCPPDQGCAGGQCIAACDAAAASQGNVGCDFVMSTPHFYVGIAPPCFAAFIPNNWDEDAQIEVTRGTMSYNVTQFGRIASTNANPSTWPVIPATGIPPGAVGVLFLSDDPASTNGGNSLDCPVVPAVRGAGGTAIWPGNSTNGTGKGIAFHIKSSAPVSTYDILPFGGALSYLPSAELVFPTSAWGTNYVAVLPPPSSGPPWAQIIASQDATTIQVLPNVALPAGTGVTAAPANATATFTLNAGEYIQWQGPEMTGSILQSDKPIAFMGGDAYQCYSSATSGPGGCDSGHQLVPPVRALGFDYIAPPFKSRTGTESVPYLIVGAVDGTTLSYNPPIPGAPPTIAKGQNIKFESTLPFQVKAQDNNHPFYLGQEMPGDGGIGDEDFVDLEPPAQWLSKYVFYTDYSYPTTNLVFVRVKGADGFKDVSVDCAGGPLTGWVPIGTDGMYEITNFDLIRDGAGNGSCSNGPHTAASALPFGLMVWGLASYASYGYAGGGNAATINQVVIPPIPN